MAFSVSERSTEEPFEPFSVGSWRGWARTESVQPWIGVDALSGEQRDAPVGGKEFVDGGPAVEDAHDASAGSVHEPGGCVPQAPA